MRIRWRGLELPAKVELDHTVSSGSYGRLYIEPFERGFGITVGNSLRRILLSSLEGSAVTSIKLDGAEHEFTSLSGVMEDVSDIVLNVKSLIIRMESDIPKTMSISVKRKGIITAADIVADPAITIINKNQVIAILTDDIEFNMEMTVEKGRGYVPAIKEDDNVQEKEIGVLPIDAIYSPVVRVRYKTEQTRVGQSIDYDRLVMEIWTNGTIEPETALVESAKILRKHLGPLVQYFELGEDLAKAEAEEVPMAEEEAEEEDTIDEELKKKLDMPLQDLELSVRASNCLETAKIETVGQLTKMHESELLSLRSFGKTSLREVKRKLADLGLTIGTVV
jgi:DNA-directed RNA polymerase subunit alpha